MQPKMFVVRYKKRADNYVAACKIVLLEHITEGIPICYKSN